MCLFLSRQKVERKRKRELQKLREQLAQQQQLIASQTGGIPGFESIDDQGS